MNTAERLMRLEEKHIKARVIATLVLGNFVGDPDILMIVDDGDRSPEFTKKEDLIAWAKERKFSQDDIERWTKNLNWERPSDYSKLDL